MSERTQATPGPWFYAEDEHTWQLFGTWPSGFCPQILKAPKRDTPYAEYWPNEADAQLICAAPDLLAACEAMLADGTTQDYTAVVAQVEAAIAKARGKYD